MTLLCIRNHLLIKKKKTSPPLDRSDMTYDSSSIITNKGNKLNPSRDAKQVKLIQTHLLCAVTRLKTWLTWGQFYVPKSVLTHKEKEYIYTHKYSVQSHLNNLWTKIKWQVNMREFYFYYWKKNLFLLLHNLNYCTCYIMYNIYDNDKFLAHMNTNIYTNMAALTACQDQ